MKMIIVLDKICLAGVIMISAYVGYKAGVSVTILKYAMEQVNAKEENE